MQSTGKEMTRECLIGSEHPTFACCPPSWTFLDQFQPTKIPDLNLTTWNILHSLHSRVNASIQHGARDQAGQLGGHDQWERHEAVAAEGAHFQAKQRPPTGPTMQEHQVQPTRAQVALFWLEGCLHGRLRGQRWLARKWRDLRVSVKSLQMRYAS